MTLRMFLVDYPNSECFPGAFLSDQLFKGVNLKGEQSSNHVQSSVETPTTLK